MVTLCVYDNSSSQVFFDATYSPSSGSVSVDIKRIMESLLRDFAIINSDEIHYTAQTVQIKIEDDTELWISSYNIFPGTFAYFKAIGTLRPEVDCLRVPQDYRFPFLRASALTTLMCRDAASNGVISSTVFPAMNSWGNISIQRIPDTSRLIQYTITGRNQEYSPLLQVCPGHFEQYMFFNERCGFYNIPMDGALALQTTHEFQNIDSGSFAKKYDSEKKDVWEQNSGFLTKPVALLLNRMLHSRWIYHLKDGKWKRITITGCNFSMKSTDSLHSLTFSYKYAE